MFICYKSSGNFIPHRISTVRRSSKRGRNRVPNQLSPIPKNPFHAIILRTSNLRRESLPRTTLRSRNHQHRIRAIFHDGQMRPPPWQVHGLLSHVPRRRRAEGRQRRRRQHQNQANHSVRGLVSHWFQVWDQLPAADGGAGRGLGEGAEGDMYDIELDERGGGVFED